MRTPLAFAFCVLLAGCGGSTPPVATTAPSAVAADSPPPVPVPIALAGHELDVTKQVVPSTPVAGQLGGAQFTPRVTLAGAELTFKSADAGVERTIALTLPAAAGGVRLVIRSDQPPGPGVPSVEALTQVGTSVQYNSYLNGYALTLELAPRQGNRQSGTLSLSLPDAAKSWLAGAFTAEVQRTPDERPGPEDAPYVQGLVTLPPGTVGQLQVGLLAAPGGLVRTETVSLKLADPGARSARTESARPTRLATSAAGEYRYEHTKLEPGRTLIWARVRGDLAAWKWVSVAEGATDDVPLTLDPAATGGVTVKAADAAGTVKLLPRDDGPTPAEIPELALAFALPLEAPVAEADRRFVAVPVGKYLAIRVGADGSVRARAPVEVKRGEVVTVELK